MTSIWIVLGAFAFIVVTFEGSYRLSKRAEKTLKVFGERLRPKLSVYIENDPVSTGYTQSVKEQGLFWRLKVVNISKAPIERCYGQITHCYMIGDDGQIYKNPAKPWPQEGHGLPWARNSGGTYEITLGGKESAFLDYIMIHDQEAMILYIPSRPESVESRPNYTSYPIQYEYLEIEIIVGTRSQVMERSRIRFTFKREYQSKAIITELENTSPRESDKRGSQT